MMMKKLMLEHEKSPDKQIRLGINWLFEPGTNFYRYTWNLRWLNPTHRRGISKYDDYLFLLNTDQEFKALANKPVVFIGKSSNVLLLKNSK